MTDLVRSGNHAKIGPFLERFTPSEVAWLVSRLPKEEQTLLLSLLTPSKSTELLDAMHPEKAKATREQLQYPKNTAGGLMTTQFLAYEEDKLVSDVLSDIEKNREQYSDYEVQYAYVFSEDEKLVGVIRLRDLVLAKGGASIDRYVIRKPLHIATDARLKNLIQILENILISESRSSMTTMRWSG